MKTLKNPFSFLTLLLIIGAFTQQLIVHFPTNILAWDTFGAYLYLPATFIYNDPTISDLSWVNQVVDQYNNTPYLYQGYLTETGNWMIKYPSGFSLIFMPFFFVGHVLAWMTGDLQDGFSAPYQYAILFGHWFYVISGLVVIRKVLLNFFSDKIVFVLLVALFFGTNYFYTVISMPAMPHGYLFFFYGLIIWFTIKWHKSTNTKNSVFLALSLGLATLARASEIIAILIPMFWDVYSKESFKEKIRFLKDNRKQFFTVVIVFIFCGLPQLLYWKSVSGHFFVDSYNNPGEGFDFLSPHTLDYLFSYRKGWLLYTPMMLFAIGGMFIIFRKNKNIALSIIVFTVFNILLLSSWTCWWYAESFGQRSIVQSYVVLLIPMGYFFVEVFKKDKIRPIVYGGIVCFFCFLNIFQTWQANNGLIDLSRMTKSAYWSNFLSFNPGRDYNNKLLLDKAVAPEIYMLDNEKFYSKTVLLEGFEDVDTSYLKRYSSHSFSGKKCSLADTQHPYSKDVSIAYNEIADKQDAIIKITAMIYFEGSLDDVKPSVVAKFRHKGKPYTNTTLELEKIENRVTSGKWNKVEMNFHTPTVRNPKDDIQIFGWLRGDGFMLIDDIQVIAYIEKGDLL